MGDIRIRDVPDDVLAAIDANASRLGLSRTQYLRRKLAQAAQSSAGPVTSGDLRAFSASFADLAGDEVTSAAWR